MTEKELKNYQVEIILRCEWTGTSEEDIRTQIDEEWGGFGDIENDISIGEITTPCSPEVKENKCCNQCEHIDDCTSELLKDNLDPNKYVCENFSQSSSNMAREKE